MGDDRAASARALRDGNVEQSGIEGEINRIGGNQCRRAIDLDGTGLGDPRRHRNDIASGTLQGIDLRPGGDIDRSTGLGGGRQRETIAGSDEIAIAIGDRIAGGEQQVADVEPRRAADQHPTGRVEPDADIGLCLDVAVKPDLPRRIGRDDAVEHGDRAGKLGGVGNAVAGRQEVDRTATGAGVGGHPVDRRLGHQRRDGRRTICVADVAADGDLFRIERGGALKGLRQQRRGRQRLADQ